MCGVVIMQRHGPAASSGKTRSRVAQGFSWVASAAHADAAMHMSGLDGTVMLACTEPEPPSEQTQAQMVHKTSSCQVTLAEFCMVLAYDLLDSTRAPRAPRPCCHLLNQARRIPVQVQVMHIRNLWGADILTKDLHGTGVHRARACVLLCRCR